VRKDSALPRSGAFSAPRLGSSIKFLEGRGTEGEVVISASPAPQRHLQSPPGSNSCVSRTRDSEEVVPHAGDWSYPGSRMVTLHRGANGGLGIGFAMVFERDSKDQTSAHGSEKVVDVKTVS
jgi:hypothetical protein